MTKQSDVDWFGVVFAVLVIVYVVFTMYLIVRR